MVTILLPLLLSINIIYPIPSLGNCQSKADCRAFCSFSVNQEVCTDYGKKMGLIKEGAVLGNISLNYPIAELGNCTSKETCKAYCNVLTNHQACLNFAKDKGIIKTPSPTPTPLENPKTEKLTNLKFPIADLGNCGSIDECKSFCDKNENRQACFEYGRKQGLAGDQSAATELGGVQFPITELGNCASVNACENYCEDSTHRQACLNFAKAHGFSPPSDRRGPGGCTSDEECQKYCESNPNNEECQKGKDEFCQKNPDKCKKGPGGCQSDSECKTYCKNNPTDSECQKGKEEYCQKNPNQCKQQNGPGGCQSDEECKKNCESNPSNEECQKGREQYCQQHPNDCQKGLPGQGQRSGPGECKSDEECQKYCQQPEHREECQKFGDDYCAKNPSDQKCQNKEMKPGENQPPEENRPKENEPKGPGGCNSPEECTKYCSDPTHQSECQKGV